MGTETTERVGHSLAPWRVDGVGTLACVRADDGVIVAVRHRVGGKQNEANARLIAAAPDLLAACQAALAYDTAPSQHDWATMRDTLIAAIAKATEGNK